MRKSPTATTTLIKVLSLIRLLPISFHHNHPRKNHRHSIWRASAFISHQHPPPSSSSRHPLHRIAARTTIGYNPNPSHDDGEAIANIPTTNIAPSSVKDITHRITAPVDAVVVAAADTIMTPLTYEILREQNATTTNAIIEHYSTSNDFASLSESEGRGILQRDDEDGTKLQLGIDIAKGKGVLDPNYVPEEYISIDVLGKSPEDVADEILDIVRKGGGDGDGASSEGGGGVVVLCGLSGTGKGTTVATLQEKLMKEDNKRVVCWSNGNVFRSVTLLAVTWCEIQDDCADGKFDPERALTKENLASFMGMLEFGKFNGNFDTKITGLGLDMLVSEVQNTALKSPKVSKNIPTVAEVTQGEVVLFASDAIAKMGEDGIFVLLEGREQTVNYVRTPLRFTLTLSDMSLIGKRRAAQRLAAGALGEVVEGASEEDIAMALDGQLSKMVAEI